MAIHESCFRFNLKREAFDKIVIFFFSVFLHSFSIFIDFHKIFIEILSFKKIFDTAV